MSQQLRVSGVYFGWENSCSEILIKLPNITMLANGTIYIVLKTNATLFYYIMPYRFKHILFQSIGFHWLPTICHALLLILKERNTTKCFFLWFHCLVERIYINTYFGLHGNLALALVLPFWEFLISWENKLTVKCHYKISWWRKTPKYLWISIINSLKFL